MIVSVELLYENDDEHEAWFSSRGDLEAESTVLYVPAGVWIAMGRPQSLDVRIARGSSA